MIRKKTRISNDKSNKAMKKEALDIYNLLQSLEEFLKPGQIDDLR